MRKLIGALFVAGLLVGSASAQGPGGRIYFDRAGNGGDETAAHPGATVKENPVLNGGGRLYIYWEFGGADQKVLSPNFNVEVDGGTINQAYYYNWQNVANLFGPRWNTAAPRPPVNNPGNVVEFKAGSIDKFAVKNDAVAQTFDTQYKHSDGSTILGYVDVSSGGQATVWFRVGTLGIAIQGGNQETPIRFGFGDASVRAGSRDRSSAADATIIPEPASLMLLGLGALALRRRS
jgi:hypothetical protein